MKRLRWICGGLVVLIVAVVVAVYAVIASLDLEEVRGMIEAKAKAATGRQLSLDGPIHLGVSLTPSIVIGDVRFAHAPWGSRPDMATIKRFRADLALWPLLAGDIELERVVLIEPNILLETDVQGRGNWLLGDAAKERDELGAGAGSLPFVPELLIRDATVRYQGGQGDGAWQLQLERADIRADGPEQPLRVAIDGTYQAMPFRISGELGAVQLLAAADRPYPVDLSGRLAAADLAVAGSLIDVLGDIRPDLLVSLTTDNLQSLENLAAVALPPLGPIAVSGNLKGEAEGYVVSDLLANVGGSDFRGDARLVLDGSRPALWARFDSSMLEIGDFVVQSGGAAEGETRAVGRYLIPDQPLPIASLAAFDADVALTAAIVRVTHDIEVEDLTALFTLNNGRLRVKPLSARLSGGDLAATVDLDAHQQPAGMAVRATARGLDYGHLLSEFGVRDVASGMLDLDFDISGSGASLRHVAAGLDGRVDLVVGKGEIANRLFKMADMDTLDPVQALTHGSDAVSLSCAVVRFTIADGVARTSVLLIDTKPMSMAGEGAVDLRTETVDLRIIPHAGDPSLMSLALPIRISGPLVAPSVTAGAAGASEDAPGVSAMSPHAAIGATIADSERGEPNPCVAAAGKSSAGGGQGAAPTGGPPTEAPLARSNRR